MELEGSVKSTYKEYAGFIKRNLNVGVFVYEIKEMIRSLGNFSSKYRLMSGTIRILDKAR